MNIISTRTMNENDIDYEPYILNESNMLTYLKYKLNNSQNKLSKTIKDDKIIKDDKFIKDDKIIKNNENMKDKFSIFIPKENDTLFWCYYIISNGDSNYEMLNVRNTLIEKQHKINYVNKIRENKQVVKMYKFDTLTNIESNLANDNYINIKTVISLFSIDKINIIFISRKTYFELLMNDDKPIYIIREIEFQSKYNKKYGFEVATANLIEEVRTKLYKVDSLDKPIKSISSYKLPELIDICNKLAIEIKRADSDKNKTKNELYEAIIQYF